MDLLVNDLSVHKQFRELGSFLKAFSRLIKMRDVAKRWGTDIFCGYTFSKREPISGVSMQSALNHLPEPKRRASLIWLTKGGRFWDDIRQHRPDDWLECGDEKIVTDCAVGEAAYRCFRGVSCGLASLVPSDWDHSPVVVVWRREEADTENTSVDVQNWRDVATLKRGLELAEPPLKSWNGLEHRATKQFSGLVFADKCFDPLTGVPFAKSAAERFLDLLKILDQRTQEFDLSGKRTAEGQRIYQNHFTGDSARFSDSSKTEKERFRQELTFPRPGKSEESLFCTWHGKVRHMTLRLHYFWSAKRGDPVYITYAGPKITRK